MRKTLHRGAGLRTSGRLFNEWINKSRADLALLTTSLPTGPYPYAGIPWFSTPFGRDAIVTALQMMWLDPSLARGVLAFLAQNQAVETSPFRDSAPGKILHETRKGEIEIDGDSNDDGFLDYARGAASGLANQGWKDSHDLVFHADGSEAPGLSRSSRCSVRCMPRCAR